MGWLTGKAKPSRPPEFITPLGITFIGEQSGPVEDDLKSRFREILSRTPTVQSAYLARLSIGDPGYTVGLCIRSSVGKDDLLQNCLARVFAELFRAEEHLDILFMQDDQEAELRKVCRAFYEKG
jgi:hypothetical protein